MASEAAAPDNAVVDISEGDIRFPVIGFVSSVAVVINLVFSTPLYSFCLISVFESTGSDTLRTPMTPLNIFFRASLMLLLSVVGEQVPYVIELIGLVSSVFVCCNNVLFPIVFVMLAPGRPPMPMSKKCSIGATLLIGTYVLVFGFAGSISTLIEKLAEDRSNQVSASREETVLPGISTAARMVKFMG
eukprot:CAMPEP_0115592782 /NCGR_PEP_ID=MMETSP0272-20121206/10961_1 /TAXON_ID=71861 /ORGANISM="Scrippsiella trochoidea, Strain CCMP3099" /LENGTH=187 /DNA_ID=CAMNT_0003028027 /DNA_START=157 /DNA_END=719 /DNA_ORIENTATION=-